MITAAGQQPKRVNPHSVVFLLLAAPEAGFHLLLKSQLLPHSVCAPWPPTVHGQGPAAVGAFANSEAISSPHVVTAARPPRLRVQIPHCSTCANWVPHSGIKSTAATILTTVRWNELLAIFSSVFCDLFSVSLSSWSFEHQFQMQCFAHIVMLWNERYAPWSWSYKYANSIHKSIGAPYCFLGGLCCHWDSPFSPLLHSLWHQMG